ncbi:MAG TPA: YdeI/OmpD-associated family protein [Thermoanaerobaculia bacterium]|nr:YdeI/OmpD-associated family protein [Thermoanaerobaculia bacterium]
MPGRDPRVDAYIAKSPEYAKPILAFVRDVVHAAVPDVEETIKWGAPHFNYKGMLLGMAAFKQHAGVNFWKGPLIGVDGFGDVRSVEDLPPKKELIGLVQKLAALNEQGAKVERPKRARKEIETPKELAAALKKNPKAQATFDKFSPSHRREYVEWIAETKSDETRRRRIDQAIEWISAGKPRNWKYMKTR